MILLSKKEIVNNIATYYNFEKILVSGYNIKEDKDRITQKFANGHRKQFVTTYTDCIITITLDTEDITTTKNYLDKLTSGTYKYYSLEDKQYKEAQFIIETKPELIVESSIDSDAIISSYQITLLKAGD